jgi:carboxyl-terminal processing protease
MTQAVKLRWLAVLVAALALAMPARAAEEHKPQPYVVLVGISDYADKQIKPRPLAEADAKALYDVFTSKDYLGVGKDNIRLLLGSPDKQRDSQPATRENILKALQWLTKEAKPTDLVIFAFVGEGGPLGDSGDRRCYFASDSTFKGRDKDALAATEVGDALKDLKSERFCVFLDVNFKGYTGEAAGVGEPTLGASPYKEFLGDDGSDEHLAHTGRVLFLANNGLANPIDAKENGVFAQALVAGLKGAADKDGYEPDGNVTVDELTAYLDKELPKLAREFGKTKEEQEQPHFVLGGRATHYVLTKNPAAVAPAKERLEKFAKLIADKKVSATEAEEGIALLERMPKLEAKQKLRKEYQALADGKTTPEKFESARDDILAGMKMKRSDALVYAEKIVEVSRIIKNKYYKEENQGELVNWAVTDLYHRLDEKIPDDIADRLKEVKKMKEAELTVLLTDAREKLGTREDLADHKDVDITLVRMLSHLDPYTTYIDPESQKRFEQEIKAHFNGIGIQIRHDPITDQLMVVTPIKGSPAYKKELMAGDLITKIIREVDSDGTKLPQVEELPTKGMILGDAVKKILGKPGTNVKLEIQREGVAKPFVVEITRGPVEVETVMGVKRKSDDEWEYMIDEKNKIGYIRLTVFADNSFRDLASAMDDLRHRGVKGFILDLRFNPGGLLGSAVNISDLFIEGGRIVSVRPRVGKEDKYNSKLPVHLTNFPMVCLVNGGSASGSEIVAACLQDHNRAYVMGERSYGKGSVQTIQDYDAGSLKYTIATFWRPSDKNLNKLSTQGRDEDEWGVVPDKVIKLNRKERDDLAEHQRELEIIQRKDKDRPMPKETKPPFKDQQLEAAVEYLRGQLKVVEKNKDK